MKNIDGEHVRQRVATARKYSSEAALSLRSRRSGTKFAVSLLAKRLIKCRRLPRGFLWNTSLPSLGCYEGLGCKRYRTL